MTITCIQSETRILRLTGTHLKDTQKEQTHVHSQVSYIPNCCRESSRTFLGDLPPELILEMSLHLQESDKECLRLTCKSFRDIVPPASFPRNKWDIFPFALPGNVQRLEFIHRLFSEGNIFYEVDMGVCCFCLQVLPAARFSRDQPRGSEKYERTNYDRCNDCLETIIRSGIW